MKVDLTKKEMQSICSALAIWEYCANEAERTVLPIQRLRIKLQDKLDIKKPKRRRAKNEKETSP